MERTWKPTAAGILSIVSGALGLVLGLLLAIGLLLANSLENPEWGLAVFYSAVPFVFGILALVGGCFALSRRIWWLALAGSLAAVPLTLLPGIASIIFVSLSKREFT